VENNIEEEILIKKISNEDLISKYLDNKKIAKIIYVKNRIINYIVK
jgi:leucyl-tRNA synthetase